METINRIGFIFLILFTLVSLILILSHIINYNSINQSTNLDNQTLQENRQFYTYCNNINMTFIYTIKENSTKKINYCVNKTKLFKIDFKDNKVYKIIN